MLCTQSKLSSDSTRFKATEENRLKNKTINVFVARFYSIHVENSTLIIEAIKNWIMDLKEEKFYLHKTKHHLRSRYCPLYIL